MNEKEQLIKIFRERVKGRRPDVSTSNPRHDGKYGHWLERQYQISANADNKADILGYELKNATSSKTTFGDWSPNYFIFKDKKFFHIFNGDKAPERQDQFVRMFGKPNAKKQGRYSWSGQPIPKLGNYNSFGTIMVIEPNLDIAIYYDHSKDQRIDKSEIVHPEFRNGIIEIARWFGATKPANCGNSVKTLKEKLEDKFNQNGWFTCKLNSQGAYDRICFGAPMNYDNWIELVRSGEVFFDSGMYEGNNRPYCQWRANNSFWESLITDCYS